jgi:hypothetical protein
MNSPNSESGPTLNINVGDIAEKEVIMAVRQLRNGRPGGLDKYLQKP